MEANRATLGLSIDLDQEPVRGEVSANGGSAHGFSGYAGLIAAVESIRAELADSGDHGWSGHNDPGGA